jgi:hypothetical protein
MNKTDGIGKDEIKNRIEQSKKIISCLNSIWWDKHIRKGNKNVYRDGTGGISSALWE